MMPLTAEEARRQAEAEGLTLVRAEGGSTGYWNACRGAAHTLL